MANNVLLSSLTPGQKGTIMLISGPGQIRRRYMEMGFVKGEVVQVKRLAPLGDPVEYQVKGYRVSLRQTDAARIEVTLCHGSEDE
ncbi:MAG TPA: ferrous iron transport protein A [Patescibacteria group bacterium]|jgi:Fe2+ transport system protein FeoA|nr:ferrous iron transport protein A [Patescibacteria group bacterium]